MPRALRDAFLCRPGRARPASGQKVAIFGQAGAGKSSLLTKMTKGGVRPLPTIGVQTDATNWAEDGACTLVSHYDGRVFVDVPGYTDLHPSSLVLRDFPFRAFDTFVFVIKGKILSADEAIFHALASTGTKTIVVRTHAESLTDEEQYQAEGDIKKHLRLSDSQRVWFVSNRNSTGIQPVYNAICRR